VSPNRPILAVYGGTFDPFHIGHAAVCSAVLAEARVAELRLIPCSIPALKDGACATAAQRLQMLAQWQQDSPFRDRIQVDGQEIQRQGPSHTVDTLAALIAQRPEYRIVFVLGSDAWNSLPLWHRFKQLVSQVSFWVFSRSGADAIRYHPGLTPCHTKEDFFQAESGRFWIEQGVQIPLSSSELRQTDDFENWPVPLVIQNYIKEHNLYRKSAGLDKSERINDR
jgi:nicotinate-nucleotide adenylyltransferase